jgi:hypothetical protein
VGGFQVLLAAEGATVVRAEIAVAGRQWCASVAWPCSCERALLRAGRRGCCARYGLSLHCEPAARRLGCRELWRTGTQAPAGRASDGSRQITVSALLARAPGRVSVDRTAQRCTDQRAGLAWLRCCSASAAGWEPAALRRWTTRVFPGAEPALAGCQLVL